MVLDITRAIHHDTVATRTALIAHFEALHKASIAELAAPCNVCDPHNIGYMRGIIKTHADILKQLKGNAA